MNTAYIALGSNLNDPKTQLLAAVDALQAHPYITLINLAPFYQSKPWQCDELQADYINSAAKLTTSLMPYDLLQALHQLEATQGRLRDKKNQPRNLDLDLLLYNDICVESEDLTLPHPRMLLRNFVIYPLYDIAPELILPCQRSLADIYHRVPANNLKKLNQISALPFQNTIQREMYK